MLSMGTDYISAMAYIAWNRIILQISLAGAAQRSRKSGAVRRRENKFELRENDKKFAKQQAWARSLIR